MDASNDPALDDELPGERHRPHPSPLRLWGFLVTVVGGTLVGVGALLSWAEVSIGTKTGSFEPDPVPGIDLLAGKVALGAAIVILLGIPAMRQAVTRNGRRAWAIVIVALGLLAGGLALWTALDPDARLDQGIDATLEETARTIADQTDLPADTVLERLQSEAVTTVTVQTGVWVVLVGGVLTAAGGALGLAWASKAPLPRDPDEDTDRRDLEDDPGLD